MDVELDLEGHHVMLPGNGIGYPIQAKGIILSHLSFLFKAEDIV